VVNKCIEHYLWCMTGDCPNQWARWLPLAEWLPLVKCIKWE
jgi:hypothetical protein